MLIFWKILRKYYIDEPQIVQSLSKSCPGVADNRFQKTHILIKWL